MTHDDAPTPADRQSLRGRRGWLITDGKAGMVVQVRGVADALALDYELKMVAPTGLARVLAPWGPVGADARFDEQDSQFAPPWPDIVIATGRSSIPYLREVRKRAGPSTFSIVLQDPKSGRDTADLIWVPQHDRRRDINVITTLTSPHSFSAERIANLRATMPEAIAALPGPRITVILGGKNGSYKFRDEDDERIERALGSMRDLGVSFMITTSRRTHQRLLQAVKRATDGAPRLIWEGEGDNPYPDYLAHADGLVVTADSVNMTGEACATGKPVYVYFPSGGSAKFGRFHAALQAHGATRPLPDTIERFETWSYEPLQSARKIADEIEARWRKRCEVLPGMIDDKALPHRQA